MGSKKISIVFCIDFMNAVSGTERQLLELINRIDKDTFRVLLICLRPLGPFNLPGKVEYEELGIRKILSFSTFYKIGKLALFLKREKIDIIQCFFIDSLIVGGIASIFSKLTVTISCRRDLGYWYTKKLLFVLWFLNRHVDRFQVNSKAVADIVTKHEKISKSKIDVIYNGIDIDRCASSIPEVRSRVDFGENKSKTYRVGIVGNYNREVKRFDIFLRACAKILEKYDNVQFFMVGGGHLHDELKSLACALGISGKVNFTGVSWNVFELISEWDVAVLSSDSEGFPNVILEYMAAGIPVVATAVGGVPELVEDGKTGFLVPVGDYQAIAEKVLTLFENREIAHKMGQRAQSVVRENYAWDNKIKEIEVYYQNLLGANS